MTAPDSGLPIFHAPFAPPDEDLAAAVLADAARDADAESRIDIRAKKLVEAIRAKAGGVGGIDDFLHAYSLSTKEGLALMVLAEALLRIPDAATADRLIEDKLAAGDWSEPDTSGTFLVSASAWTLGITARGPTGDAAPWLALRAGADHRGGTVARGLAPRVPLFVRHAGRGRAHREG